CSDSEETDCLSPTVIAYQAGQAVTSTSAIGASNVTTLIGAADFNGDRRDDLIYLNNGAWYVLFGVNGGLGSPVRVSDGSANLVGTFGTTVDYDIFFPDGRAAFISLEGDTLYTYSAVDTNG